MAHQSPIQHYRSVTPGVAPPSLLGGELFINEADSKLFYRASDGSVQFNQLSTVKDDVSSGITRTGHFSHRTTGTPAIGIGAGIEFEVQTAAATFKVGAAIDVVSTAVIAGTESFDLVFKTMAAGAVAAEKMRIASSGNITAGNFSIVGNTVTLPGVINTGSGVSTGDAAIELGSSRTGDGNSYIDFHSQAGVDYNFRIIRAPGVNGGASISHLGTGTFDITAQGAATLTLGTGGISALSIDPSQHVSLNSPPAVGDNSSRIATTAYVMGSYFTFQSPFTNTRTYRPGGIYNFARVYVNPSNSFVTGLNMMGWGVTFTPNVSGNMLIIASFDATDSGGRQWAGELRFGTGTPPANNSGQAGTALTGRNFVGPDQGGSTLMGMRVTLISVSTLVVGVTYWLDLVLLLLSGTQFTSNNAEITVAELP